MESIKCWYNCRSGVLGRDILLFKQSCEHDNYSTSGLGGGPITKLLLLILIIDAKQNMIIKLGLSCLDFCED